VALVRTDISEERIAFNMRLNRISDLGTMLAVNRNSVFFHPDDAGDTFLRNACSYKRDMASYSRRRGDNLKFYNK
jgi:hypothetical protein